MNAIIRKMQKEEYPLLETFLYEAISQRDPENLLPRNVIYKPELWVYIDRFGELPDDLCLCAELNGNVVGAVWTRIIPAYGKKAGEEVEFGGLLGYAPVMPISTYSCEKFIARGGRIPAPIHSLKN